MHFFTPKLLCPFCCASFASHEMRFRCASAHCLGMVHDPLYSRVSGIPHPPKMGRILVPAKKGIFFGGDPREAICDSCHERTTMRICPECHGTLPEDIGQVEQYFFTLLGNCAAGKTHYLVSLLAKLQHEIGPHVKMVVRPLGELGQLRWSRLYTTLFEQKTVLPATEAIGAYQQLDYPLAFQFTLIQNERKRTVNVSFFDPSGADSSHSNLATKRYLRFAHAFLFFIDPLTITNIRAMIGNLSGEGPRSEGARIPLEQQLLTFIQHIKKEYRLQASDKVSIPTTFVLSKSDIWQAFLEPDSPILRSTVYDGAVEPEQLQSVSTEMNSLLSSWLGPQFGQIIRSEFTNYAYFGVSALGRQADHTNHLSAINPSHVEDPFLWLLIQLHMLQNRVAR